MVALAGQPAEGVAAQTSKVLCELAHAVLAPEASLLVDAEYLDASFQASGPVVMPGAGTDQPVPGADPAVAQAASGGHFHLPIPPEAAPFANVALGLALPAEVLGVLQCEGHPDGDAQGVCSAHPWKLPSATELFQVCLCAAVLAQQMVAMAGQPGGSVRCYGLALRLSFPKPPEFRTPFHNICRSIISNSARF